MSDKHVRIIVIGRVQGVFYRASTLEKARQLKLVGWVRNNPDGNVEIDVQGTTESITMFKEWCKKGPQFAKVEHIEIKELDITSEFTTFEINY